jgi:hypothetical protein
MPMVAPVSRTHRHGTLPPAFAHGSRSDRAARFANAGSHLSHGFNANAQNHFSFVTCALVKLAAVSSSVNPLFGCPE